MKIFNAIAIGVFAFGFSLSASAHCGKCGSGDHKEEKPAAACKKKCEKAKDAAACKKACKKAAKK